MPWAMAGVSSTILGVSVQGASSRKVRSNWEVSLSIGATARPLNRLGKMHFITRRFSRKWAIPEGQRRLSSSTRQLPAPSRTRSRPEMCHQRSIASSRWIRPCSSRCHSLAVISLGRGSKGRMRRPARGCSAALNLSSQPLARAVLREHANLELDQAATRQIS